MLVSLLLVEELLPLEHLLGFLGLFGSQVGHRPLCEVGLAFLHVQWAQRYESLGPGHVLLSIVRNLREVKIFGVHDLRLNVLHHVGQVVGASRHVGQWQLAGLHQRANALFHIRIENARVEPESRVTDRTARQTLHLAELRDATSHGVEEVKLVE